MQTEFELWKQYEQVAMHFNSLIMQFRLQLLGGAGLIGTAATYFIGGRVEDATQRAWLRSLLASGFLVLLFVLAMVDVLYYNKLLRGAVDEILKLEARSETLKMSTTIEAWVGPYKYVPHTAYGIVLVLLSMFVWWSWIDYRRERHRVPTTPVSSPNETILAKPLDVAAGE